MSKLKPSDFDDASIRFLHILLGEEAYDAYNFIFTFCIKPLDYFNYCDSVYIKLYGSLPSNEVVNADVYNIHDYPINDANKENVRESLYMYGDLYLFGQRKHLLDLIFMHSYFTPEIFTPYFFEHRYHIDNVMAIATYFPSILPQLNYYPYEITDFPLAIASGLSPQKGLETLISDSETYGGLERLNDFKEMTSLLLQLGAKVNHDLLKVFIETYDVLIIQEDVEYILRRLYFIFLHISPFEMVVQQQAVDILINKTIELIISENEESLDPDDEVSAEDFLAEDEILQHLKSYVRKPWSLNNRQFETKVQKEIVDLLINNHNTPFNVLPIELLEYILSFVVEYKLAPNKFLTNVPYENENYNEYEDSDYSTESDSDSDDSDFSDSDEYDLRHELSDSY